MNSRILVVTAAVRQANALYGVEGEAEYVKIAEGRLRKVPSETPEDVDRNLKRLVRIEFLATSH